MFWIFKVKVFDFRGWFWEIILDFLNSVIKRYFNVGFIKGDNVVLYNGL